jgi:hypothetical protein
MKRNEIVKSLLKEGFSEKTLVNFSDNQLTTLASRILGESDVMISKNDPLAAQKIKDAKSKDQSIETYEEDMKEDLIGNQKKLDKNHNGKIDSQDFKILKGQKKKNLNKKDEKENIKEWVSTVTKKNFHSFTSKNEIMEMIQFKLKEQEVGSKVKKGHNGIPEFMTYDSIASSAPSIAPSKPKIKPEEKPSRPKRDPFNPGPKPSPRPKAAFAENAPSIAPSKPKIKPEEKPSRPKRDPFNPGPKPSPRPKASN